MRRRDLSLHPISPQTMAWSKPSNPPSGKSRVLTINALPTSACLKTDFTNLSQQSWIAMTYHKSVFLAVHSHAMFEWVSLPTDHVTFVIKTKFRVCFIKSNWYSVFVDKRAESEFKVWRDVSHLAGQFRAEFLDVSPVFSHRVGQIHQKVQIQRIVFGRSELYGDVVRFSCNQVAVKR